MKENMEYVHEYDDFPQDGHADYYGMDENRSKKNKYGQMHLHTPASDGLITPQNIIDAGLDFVCITDHDNMYRLKEYREALEPKGIKVIPGAELTTEYRSRKIHVLIYNPLQLQTEWDSELTFFMQMEDMDRRRTDQAFKIIGNLISLDFEIDYGFVERQQGVITKMNTAREIFKSTENVARLKEAGICSEVKFIDEYLDAGKPAFVPLERIWLGDYLRYVEGAKVLAHPGHDLKMGRDDSMIEELVKHYGFKGIEVNTRKHTPIQREYYGKLAEKLGIVAITSNDCHRKEDLYENKESEETLERLLGMKVNI